MRRPSMERPAHRRMTFAALLAIATTLTATTLTLGACKKQDDLRDDEALKVVVAADRKLAEQEESILARRGALRRERVKVRDQRTSLITQKASLTEEDDPTKRKALEDAESKLVKLEAKLANQEVQLNQKLATVLERKSGLVDKAEKNASVRTLLLGRREHSVALREKDLAHRESELARRERGLADRERGFAVRQAKLCPGRITTVVQTVAAPPPRRPVRGERYTRKDVEPVYRAALKAMTAKGILVADLPPGIDRLVTEVRHAGSKGDYSRAKYAADQLLGAVRSINIDRAFIGAKIGRLSRSIARTPPAGGRKSEVQGLFQRATSDYGDGRFRAANKKLNRIYALLR